MVLVNGKPLTSFPRPLMNGKVHVFDLPPRFLDDELRLLLEICRGHVRIRQSPNEDVELEIYVTRDGSVSVNVYGVTKEYTMKALGLDSITVYKYESN